MTRLAAVFALAFALTGCCDEPAASEAGLSEAPVTAAAAHSATTEYVVEGACPHAAAQAHVAAEGGHAHHADCGGDCDGHGADADEACGGDCGGDCADAEDQPTS